MSRQTQAEADMEWIGERLNAIEAACERGADALEKIVELLLAETAPPPTTDKGTQE